MSAPRTPTTKEISDNVVNQISAQIAQQAPILPKSFTRVLAKAIAGVYVILFKYAGFIFKQLFVSTASDQTTTINGVQVNPLNEWGRLVGIPSRTPATQTELRCEVQVTAQGGTIRTGQQLVGKSNGVTYAVQGDVAISGVTAFITIQAVGDGSGGDGSGVVGDLADGAIVSFSNPLGNVSRDAVVVELLEPGVDAETTSSFRSRILDRFQKRPQGGAYADYEQWAEEAPGTLRAYPYTGGPGEVNVYIESSTEEDGYPTTAQLEEAKQFIELDQNGRASRRPVGVLVNVLPITRAQIQLEIFQFQSPSPDTRNKIRDALEEYLHAREPFIEGLSILPRKDRISTSTMISIIGDVIAEDDATYDSIGLYRSNVEILTSYDLIEGEKAELAGYVTSFEVP